jgi:hypothetical protein
VQLNGNWITPSINREKSAAPLEWSGAVAEGTLEWQRRADVQRQELAKTQTNTLNAAVIKMH